MWKARRESFAAYSHLPFDGGLNVAVRFIDGNKNVIRIVLSKRAQVRQQVVEIGHSERDARNLRRGGECGFSHVKQRVLHAHAVVRGKFLEQRGNDARADLSMIRICYCILPRHRRACAENAVRSRLKAVSRNNIYNYALMLGWIV